MATRSTQLGVVGFITLGVALVLSTINTVAGVHCPDCDRHALSDAQFTFWERYFVAKDVVYGAAALMLLLAVPFAQPRRWPFVFGLALALGALALTPM